MNKFILTGNLCADPTFTAGQEESKNRCNFRIAYNHNKDKATFFSCTAWGKTAERVSKLAKGKRILVEGDIEENEWTDQQTQAKQRDKQINVRNVEYIDFPDQTAQPTATQQPAQGYTPPPVNYGAPPIPGYGAAPAYPAAPTPGCPPAPPAAPPAPPVPAAAAPQYHTDALGNQYQLINGRWALISVANAAPPAVQPPQQQYGVPGQQPPPPPPPGFNGNSPF